MIICSSSNIDLIQGVSGYGTVSDGATDWRIENTATGVFNILNSPNLLAPNVSIIDAGNIGIGTIPVTGTNKLQVQGNLNVSGGYFVAGVAFKPATAVLADTATALATSRTIAGVGFTGAGNIDIPYFNLTNKITAGNGISLTTGSAVASPSISTNLTAGNGISISAAASPTISTNLTAGNGISISAAASPTISANLTAGNGISISAAASPVITANITAGTNITFTGTNPISISAAGGTASQWTTTGANIYYNSGNVGIGTNNPSQILQVGGGGRLRLANNNSDYTMIGTADVDSINSPRIALYGNTFSGVSGQIGYFATSTSSHVFHTTDSATERMRITSTGNVGIGTATPGYRLEVTGSTNAGSMTASYFDQTGFTLNYTGPYNGIAAKFNGATWAIYYITSSDSRIKEDIQDIIDDTALQSILSIEPKTYKYVDKLQRGDKKVYGFIAQQIKEVIPEAITIENSYIPNIYLVADYIDSVITLSSQPTKVIIKMNDKIKCYDKDNKEILVEVIDVIDDLTFRIKEIEYTDTKIFVYGTFVDDFHTLNKDYIFTLNVCATQELHRRIETQSVLLKSQDDRIKDLETKVAMLMSM